MFNPNDLNARIKSEHYHLPHKSDIVADMAGAQFFYKLDAAQGFYQMQLDEASTMLCTMEHLKMEQLQVQSTLRVTAELKKLSKLRKA